ncbi:MAG TPA: zinc-binding dehydrogenase [Candidatus Acidoferrum sp.]|jgi:NADPH:quinone reductase-like Zn-dependent oxidoreductase|nr:zinc-binding dehydrogenase [Candidatus Acidoferrum sp.]
MAAIPSGTKLTTYTSSEISASRSTATMQRIADEVARGTLDANIYRVFRFDEIVDAHRTMENDGAVGKMVVVV